MALSGGAAGLLSRPRGARDAAMRLARSCYDYLAGRLGVAIADALMRHGFVHLDDGIGLVSDEGRRFFTDRGIDVDALAPASARSAGPASTGANAACISPASSALPSSSARSSSAGSRGCRKAGRCGSALPASAALPRRFGASRSGWQRRRGRFRRSPRPSQEMISAIPPKPSRRKRFGLDDRFNSKRRLL
jgi:hypothetical protein